MSRAWSTADIPDQRGRVALVTGANSGIGYETALALADKGAKVMMACRSEERGEAALSRLLDAASDADATLVSLDLTSLESVRACAEHVAALHDRLDLLICNAGVMTPPLSRTEEGFELQFGVNHLGHFALVGHLLPLVLRTEGARVVVVSSNAHRIPGLDLDDPNYERRFYNRAGAYGQSKLANLLFMNELQRRVSKAGATTLVTAGHPGWAATGLMKGIPLGSFVSRAMAQDSAGGALPTLRAAVDPECAGGDYFGPSGIGQLKGPPVRVQPNKAANDADTAARLWSLSEELTGVRYDFGAAAT